MSGPMNPAELRARLAAVEQRLEIHAARPAPAGLTDPDPDGDERWEAGQVWAHLAEFAAYWLDEIERVIGAASAGQREPIPFGRTKADAARRAAIERDRRVAPERLLQRIREAIDRAEGALVDHLPPAWETLGIHPTLGEMPAREIFSRFVVDHLEEHAAQLDALVAGEASAPRDVTYREPDQPA